MDHLDPVDIPNAALSSAKAQEQEKDPVCGMDVNPATARFKTLHHGKEYFFCCAGCQAKFQANPEKILSSPPKPMTMGSGLVSIGGPAAVAKTGVPDTNTPWTGEGARRSTATAPVAPLAGGSTKDTRVYVCPMCPEVRQLGPGSLSQVWNGARSRVASSPREQDRIHLPHASGDRASRAR